MTDIIIKERIIKDEKGQAKVTHITFSPQIQDMLNNLQFILMILASSLMLDHTAGEVQEYEE